MDKKTIIIFILFCTLFSLKAQQLNTLFLMNNSIESNSENPSKKLYCKYLIGLPALSALHFDVGSTLSYRNIISKTGDLRLDNISKNTFSRNTISTNFSLQLISIGYKLNRKNDIFFSVSDKVYARFTYPKDFVEFGINGNKQFIGETLNLKSLSARAAYYREYSFGIARTINKRLDLGMKLKILFGKASFKSNIKELSLYTDANSYALTAKSNIELFTSMPITVATDIDGKLSDIKTNNFDAYKFIMNSANKGVAIDFGGKYIFNKKLTFTASIIDFGFIRWSSDANKFSQQLEYNISGNTYSTTSGTIIDSLRNSIKPIPSKSNFTTWLPTRTNLAIEYKYSNKISFSALSRTEILYNTFIPSFTIGASYSPNYKFSSIITWSYINNSFLNIGIGASYQIGITRFHFVTDNALAAIWPELIRGTSVRLGINFAFGCPKIKKKKVDCGCNLPIYTAKRR